MTNHVTALRLFARPDGKRFSVRADEDTSRVFVALVDK